MRKPRIIKESGPYTVKSLADGNLRVIPTWPQYPSYNNKDGGGPGLADRLELAATLEEWLNGGKQEQKTLGEMSDADS